jgi:2-keto-4-pentenoate hydratase/2-oxohepta-3-ene-1,7-dioic acid hydratase in catechol pathway
MSSLWCVGRNYVDHAKELGNSVPERPLIFLKSGHCLQLQSRIQLSQEFHPIHHEIELAFRFNQNLEFDGVALALDLTARKYQEELKKKGEPWTLAKSFKNSCPMSKTLVLKPESQYEFKFELRNSNKKLQIGHTQDMLFDLNTLRSYVVKNFPVCPGDYLLTGTPAGVGPIEPGLTYFAELWDSKSETLLSCQWMFEFGL